jgi:hypothetical protein
MATHAYTVAPKRIDIDNLIDRAGGSHESFEAATDALTVGALIQWMRREADGGKGIDRKELKHRLKKLSKDAIVNAERGVPIYEPLHDGDDAVSSNFVLLATVARVCGVELTVTAKQAPVKTAAE